MNGQRSGDAASRERLRARLVEERKRYEAIAQGLGESGLDLAMSESTGELSSFDQHTADSGSEMFERERDLGLKMEAQRTLGRIDDALDRLEAGEYGVCRSCGRPIGAERLDAIPYAEECVDCAGRHGEHAYRGPAEERSLDFAESFGGDDGSPAFDGEDVWQELAKHGTANSRQDEFGNGADLDEIDPDKIGRDAGRLA